MTTKTTLETNVISTLSKVLGVSSDKISRSDGLVNLGGNSILCAEIASALKRIYPSAQLTISDVLRSATVDGLISFLRRQGIQ